MWRYTCIVIYRNLPQSTAIYHGIPAVGEWNEIDMERKVKKRSTKPNAASLIDSEFTELAQHTDAHAQGAHGSPQNQSEIVEHDFSLAF